MAGFSVDAGQIERRDSVAIGGLHVGAGAKEPAGQVQIVLTHCPLESRGAVGFRGVHIGVPLEKRHRGRLVAGLDSVHQPDIVIGGGECGER
jgi:hypothetical protein